MKRILLKLSGEALAGAAKRGFDEETVIAVAKQIRTIAEEGTQVGIVIGGGDGPLAAFSCRTECREKGDIHKMAADLPVHFGVVHVRR